MLIAFGVSRVVKRYAVIDVFWGAGFFVIFAVSLWVSYLFSCSSSHPWWNVGPGVATARWSLLAVVALWSLRLSFYLAVRQRGTSEDSRYVMILRGAKGRNETLYALRTIFLLQAMLLWFISWPLQFVAYASSFNPIISWIAVGVVVVGVSFESIGDLQLRRFLATPANKGTTMNRGLWRYSRHPNYFGDAVVWWGIYLGALSTGWGALTILSPLLMNRLLTSVSGKPLLEGKLTKTRSGYEEYVATTSAFFPRRPRRRPDS